ncbi:hypothetical protein SEA_GILGAMESH_7 [Streptomyces phage Gilgamesh]|uniref:Uncharacterized protein n=1 Tax=Streptomyces phage Gilgamesh TaxID=2599890 RepID=A0A5J6TTK2_9CAUD|nr:hypothetical protein QEH35_gp007 [Streptomyces phage Gilgamesh]QFG13199.1 hypothetical protein SEA_GILGAMESH_7 [Streptomyces phage Gilgamesh]
MQTPTDLDIAVFREGGDPEKARVRVHVQITHPDPALLDLDPTEREDLLKGALDGIHAALPEGLDTDARMTLSEVVTLV